jgi:hypothetical protein
MIPAAILYGLIGGLIPRYRWWAIPVIGVIWSITLAVSGDPTMSLAQIWIGGFFFGALNGAVGVAFTWSVWKLIQFVFRLVRGTLRGSTSA